MPAARGGVRSPCACKKIGANTAKPVALRLSFGSVMTKIAAPTPAAKNVTATVTHASAGPASWSSCWSSCSPSALAGRPYGRGGFAAEVCTSRSRLSLASCSKSARGSPAPTGFVGASARGPVAGGLRTSPPGSHAFFDATSSYIERAEPEMGKDGEPFRTLGRSKSHGPRPNYCICGKQQSRRRHRLARRRPRRHRRFYRS